MPTVPIAQQAPSWYSTPGGASTGISAIQSVLGAYMSYTQGKAAKRTYEANANIAEINSRIAELGAKDALNRGQKVEAQYRQGTKKTIGSQRAAAAASGIRTDTGSARDIQTETANISELDAMTIKNNALREAFGYTAQGYQYGQEARNSTMQGQLAQSQGLFEGTQSLLTGGMRTLDYYNKWKAKG